MKKLLDLKKVIGEPIKKISELIAKETAIHIERIIRLNQKLIVPKKTKKKSLGKKYDNSFIVDTSVFIDGRILDIARTGFLNATLIVPEFVLGELRHIADSSDTLRRNKGRRGLEILNLFKKREIKKQGVDLVIIKREVPKNGDVDNKILALAKKFAAGIITVDYNLNKVAQVSGRKVLNVNDLATALKTPLLPGEILNIKIMQEGKEKNQGVGYLPDGTMIVVEDASKYSGKDVEIEIQRSLQTAAGRMFFATLRKNNSLK